MVYAHIFWWVVVYLDFFLLDMGGREWALTYSLWSRCVLFSWVSLSVTERPVPSLSVKIHCRNKFPIFDTTYLSLACRQQIYCPWCKWWTATRPAGRNKRRLTKNVSQSSQGFEYSPGVTQRRVLASGSAWAAKGAGRHSVAAGTLCGPGADVWWTLMLSAL